MPNLENLQLHIEPEATPEQKAMMLKERDLLSKKLAAIDAALATMKNSTEENAYEKHVEDQKKLADMAENAAQALSPENLQNIYSQKEDSSSEPVPEKEVPTVETNTYDKHLQDQAALAELVGNNAQTLSQENLQKIYMKQEEQPTAEPVKVLEVNTYDQHLEDTRKLAEIMGGAASALSPENLKKIYPEKSEEPEAVAPISTPALAQAKTELELVAERIREYNKNNTPLSPEDLKYRREHWVDVKTELMNLHKKEVSENPEPETAHNFIEYTGPTLERSRNDYALALFNNRKALYKNQEWKDSGDGVESPTLDPANQEYLKSLHKKYNDNIDAELAKIDVAGNPEGGTRLALIKARLEFVKKENEALNREMFRLENEETQKRIGKAIDKALGKAGSMLESAKEKVQSGLKNLGDRFKNITPGKGMGWLYYLAIAAASPIISGVWAGEGIGNKIDDGIAILKKKFGQTMNSVKNPPTIQEKFGTARKNTTEPNTPKSQEEAAQEKKEQETALRKKDFLEKAFGAKIEGDDAKKVEKLQNIHLGSFFNPKDTMGKSVDDYKPWQKTIYEKLLPLYEKDSNTSKNNTTLRDLINKLAEQDKLKDLWKTTSKTSS